MIGAQIFGLSRYTLMNKQYPDTTFLQSKRQLLKPRCLGKFACRKGLACFTVLFFSLTSLLPGTALAQQNQESFGFGTTGEPAPNTMHPGAAGQAQPWGPLLNVQSGVVPASEDKNQPPNLISHDNTINVWQAPKAEPKTEAAKPEESWDLSASKVTGYATNQILEAEGNVRLERGEEYLLADYALYYGATGWVYLKGNVQVYFGKDRMSAEEAEFDIASKVGWLKDGQVFMEGPHVYFSGKRINKHWGDMYSFREAKITTCDGDVPAWSMSADEAIVEIDGYARLWNTSFQVKDQTVAYSPYMLLPAKKERQTGFLTPELGYSKDNGATLNVPFFIALDKSQNLTLNADLMTERGAMIGAEYWARPDVDDELWMRVDWLYDADTSNTDTHNGLHRNNEQRFWLRGMYDGTITNSRWRLKADIDYTSDQDFLREFRSRPGMFNDNESVLLGLFGRKPRPWSSNRVSEAQLFREWDRASFYVGMSYEQDAALGHGNSGHSIDTIPQKLPEFNMYLNKGKIIDELPIEIVAEAQAVNFYRPKGSTGQRYDLYPRVSMPIHTKYFSLEPAFGLRQTQYETETTETVDWDTGDNKERSRTLAEIELTAFSELSRVYKLSDGLEANLENVGSNKWLGMRHSIQPKLNYYKLSDRNQADLPYYDYIDRRPTRDEITYSLANILGVHRETVSLDNEQNPTKSSSYLDFVRFNLEQTFDFEENRRAQDRDEYARRPFSDVLAELEITPREDITLTSRTWVSPYTGEITRHNHYLTLSKPEWGSWSTGLDFRDEPDEYWRKRKYLDERQAYLLYQGLVSREDIKWGRYDKKVNMWRNVLQFNFLDPFSLYVEHWYDLDDRRPLEYKITLDYIHQCFVLSGNMYWDSDETSFGVSFALPGFWD